MKIVAGTLVALGLSAGLPAIVIAADADMFPSGVVQQMQHADVVIIGDVHDNPAHHDRQARAIETLQPEAVVWEMLPSITADRINAGWLDEGENLDDMIAWAEDHWPNFDLYRPVLVASKGRATYGGLVPRAQARDAMETGADVAFGIGASEYGLGVPLSDVEQQKREDLQFEAHCEAMPKDMLPGLVEIQRLRDATLAREIVQAVEDTGGPVVVITGNGHARKDWGIASYLGRVEPGIRVMTIGQSEEGRIEGTFDEVLDGPSVDRPDPCAVFEKSGTGSGSD
jgi:uncharacterized iron-regulated protein